MPVETHIDAARERVDSEREAVAGKREAFDAFIERVSALSADATPGAGGPATDGGLTLADRTPSGGCDAVRTAFADTVRPHSVADIEEAEPLLATVRSELSEAVAAALAPATDQPFTPGLKRAVLSAASARRAETEVLGEALAREADRLDTARDSVEAVVAWLVEANETPLAGLGFAALRERHRALENHRERLAALARRRQEFLGAATSQGVEVGISHRELVPYLYGGFEVDHPVLCTVARLDGVCEDCQRTVRAHLVRRA